MKKIISILFLSIALLGAATAQNNPNRVYTTKMTGEVIAAYEIERTPDLVARWFATTDAATRRTIEVELASFTHFGDEAMAMRMRPIALSTKVFSAEEIRLVHYKRDISLYQQFGETENLADAKRSLTELEHGFPKN